MPPIKVISKIRNPELVIVLLNAYDRELLDQVGNHLIDGIKGSLYKRQHFLANLPVMSLMKRTMHENPDLRLLVLGNTNRNFSTAEQFDKLTDKFEGWYHSIGALNLRYFEARGDEKDVNQRLTEKVEETKNKIISDLEEIKI